jgi:predicted O-linked N-acetylglucosamine transferase (SPINDLY family)
VDVLIYPEVGMDPMTLRLASLRLASHQAVAWGHPETSGLPTIDYYLSAEALEPADAQAYYCEQLVRLPNLGCYYEPVESYPAPLDLAQLGIRPDRAVLVCPGTPFKYAPEHDQILVEIVRRLPPCQLVFFEPPAPFLARKLRERLTSVFGSAGLRSEDSLIWIPWLAPPAFCGLLRQATLCLDTIGFSGFNTAMQALEQDLPVVAYEGRFLRGRLASGLMRHMGLPDLVARNPGEYVELASRLALDEPARTGVRERLRAAKSALFRDRLSVDALSDFLAGMVGSTSRA